MKNNLSFFVEGTGFIFVNYLSFSGMAEMK